MNHRYRFLLLVIVAQLLFILNITLLHSRHQQTEHAAVVKTYLIDVDAQSALPAEIKAAAGSELIFVRKTGIVGTDVSLSQDNSDGGKTPLMSSQPSGTAVPQGYTLVSRYKVDRTGSAAIVITHRVPMPGAKPYNDTVKVTGQ